MNANLLFLDESYDDKTKISSLVGVCVPVERYDLIRSGFYSVIDPLFRPEPNVLRDPPEIHGRNLLRGESDDSKLDVVAGIVSLVAEHKIKIYRVAYVITPETEKHLPMDKMHLSTCWYGIQAALQSRLADECFIPVMDGFDMTTVKKFSGAVKAMDLMRAAGHGHALTISNSHNIIGETFYADSSKSVFIQVADIIGYLRNVTDIRDMGMQLAPFKQRLLPFAAKLDRFMICEQVIGMQYL